jgi:UDP:flavonoid glycosyltransferase YjiC (YdhE family)
MVHHGGAGTTAHALRAGIPSLVVPFGWEQHLWGRQVRDLGVGPAPIPLRDLTIDALAAALRQLLDDDSMRANARDLGRSINQEDGVAAATAVLVPYFAGRGLPRR